CNTCSLNLPRTDFLMPFFLVLSTQDGDLKFSLESVKKLKELMDENRHINPRFVVLMASYSPCDEKDLPEEFQSVCKREDASMIFERLSISKADDRVHAAFLSLLQLMANTGCEHPARQSLMC
uniref:Guanylate cyclase activator 2B n=1 Tax=Amazona collaria TaxID=241587 RepID=A0A8B9IWY1_9PSIT